VAAGAPPHPLDRPIWSALTTRQASFANNTAAAQALRFPADVSPFAAALDTSPPALAALAALIPADDDISLLEIAPPAAPPGVTETLRAPCLQMTIQSFAGGADLAADALGEADAADMLALALLTKPGPFRARTHTLGRFVGVRDNGRLVAMAGERLHVDGYVEISGVCTHPDYRGRGYGSALMRIVGDRILAEGATPFLHTYANNTGAIALYRSLGFTIRSEVLHAVWARAA
jgi:predicted GNAT family acetyltransferase